MGRRGLKLSKGSGRPENGGIFSNFGLIGGAVGVNQCDTEDDTWYCQLSRGYSALMMIISILVMCALIYYFAKMFIF